jgi:glucose-1-phosphate cytidylyltransferase
MKAVILAGGLGSRISEETNLKPKPMVEIGGKPILWHIMKIYASHNIKDFIICLGYKGYLIKEFFANYFLHTSDVTLDLKENKLIIHQTKSEDWRVTLVDTGESTMTGGRIKRVEKYLETDETFCMTYGDGVSNVNLTELIKFHNENKTYATLTAVQPPGRFGSLEWSKNKIVKFHEKPVGDGAWINGGFFVLSKNVFSFIKDDLTTWEREPMEDLAKAGQLSAYKHNDFWHPMDTLRDKNLLEDLWKRGEAPWKTWI